MSCAISGRVVLMQSNNVVTGVPNKKIYLRPSRTDFQYSLDSGTHWQDWQGDPNLLPQYPGCIATTTDASGNWTITVPWSDSTSETALPGGAPVPDLSWSIIDPNPTAGTLVYSGETKQAVVSTAKTIKQLITLSSPDTWTVRGTGISFAALPAGPRRYVDLSFTSSGTSAALTMDDIGTSAWKYNHGIESDDPTRTYTLILDTASKTATAGAFTLSDVPPVGATVIAHIEVYV